MPIPMDPRRKPADVKVHVTTNAGVDITWADGHASHYDFAYLREQCPCAMCDDQRQKERDRPAPAPLLPASELPMFKPRLAARQAKTVGSYALQIDFTDGHSTGIYSYEYLRSICPCQQCASEFRTDAS
jgi:DUF971 family protein